MKIRVIRTSFESPWQNGVAERWVVDADLPLINRVMNNLLENELAHLPTGREIDIQLSFQQDRAELVIEDNGPGFPSDIIARAFERFAKGKNSPGHGLGLAFVDAVIQAHGGSVKISNRPTGGAVIALLLPAHGLEGSRNGTGRVKPEAHGGRTKASFVRRILVG